MAPPPLDRALFMGIADVAHLAAGGETPFLHSHLAALSRFAQDKSAGMRGRDRMFATLAQLKRRLASLLRVEPGDIGCLASASEGLFVAAHGVDWRPGDNVVVALSEYPSVLHAWRVIPEIEVRAVGHSPVAELDDIRAATNARTRLIAASHVSYLTGARLDLPALREIADRVGAQLVVDASHALGVVPVDARCADVVVACAYKWMLGTHGIGVFCVNGRRWPDLRPPWIGWHSIEPEPDWRRRGSATVKATIERFEIGNPALISAYVLENGLATLMRAGIPEIERHALALGGELRDRLAAAGWPVLTPEAPERRAGNICIASERAEVLEASLRARGVLAWGGDGRLRLSVHGYNDSNDMDRAVTALGRPGG
ncbi:MAG: aminotransferase class V-fold PLP-dependent enzyme [Alphaproteobacteria bacterium]|nr:aminotransferase class V-fold PLP-dependent enzyme [Alphaproteobacteria bacterium]